MPVPVSSLDNQNAGPNPNPNPNPIKATLFNYFSLFLAKNT